MWPFTRKPPPAPGRGPEPMPVPLMRDDWKFQPPLQRAIGEHPLTAPGDVFANNLATHQDPSVVSRTLGHHVSMDAPAGLVLAIATPATRQDGPAMVSRPRVQRRASSASSSDLQSSDDDQDTAVSQPVTVPLRELTVVSGPPEVQRLTTIAPGAAPVPIGPGRSVQSGPLEIQRSTPAASDDPLTGPAPSMINDSEPAVPSRRTLGQSRRLGLGAPLAQVPVTSIQRATELALASPRREPAASQAAPEQTMATATERGAPQVQRDLGTALASPLPAHQESPQTAHAASAQMMDDAATPDPAQTSSEMRLQRLDPPLPRTGGTAAAIEAASPAVDLPAPIQRDIGAGGTEPPDISPRTVDLPLLQRRLATAIPESPEINHTAALPRDEPLEAPTVKAESPEDLSPLLAVPQSDTHQPGDESSSSMPSETRAQAPPIGSRGLSRLVQRAVPQASVHVNGMTAPGNPGQHQVVSPLSATARLYRSPELDAPGASPATPDQVPGVTLAAHRGLILQRVSSASPGVDVGPEAIQSSPLTLPLAPVATTASLQRATALAQAAAFPPAIALQRAGAETAVADRQETFFAQREGPSAASGGAPSTQAAAATEPAAQDEAMDALAGKLYDRIRNRLKSELLVDRERAGLLTDLR